MYKGLNKELKRFTSYVGKKKIDAYTLKLRRKDLGLTQKELSEKFGVERNTINRWENELNKDEDGSVKPIPIWVDLALEALEIEHAKEVRKLDREQKEAESGSTFVNSFFRKNETEQETSEVEEGQFILQGFAEN